MACEVANDRFCHRSAVVSNEFTDRTGMNVLEIYMTLVTNNFTPVIMHDVWMLQVAENFNFLENFKLLRNICDVTFTFNRLLCVNRLRRQDKGCTVA